MRTAEFGLVARPFPFFCVSGGPMYSEVCFFIGLVLFVLSFLSAIIEANEYQSKFIFSFVFFSLLLLNSAWAGLAYSLMPDYQWKNTYSPKIETVTENGVSIQEVKYRDFYYKQGDVGSFKSINLTKMFNRVFKDTDKVLVKTDGRALSLGLSFHSDLKVEVD